MQELCPEQGKPPLWLQLRNHPSLFCLHPTPGQLSILLEYLADEVERRGDIDYDRDPGETDGSLRMVAPSAIPAASLIFAALLMLS